MKALLTLICVLAVASADAAAGCGPSRFTSRTLTRPKTISLDTVARTSPAFYLRVEARSRDLVMYFKADDVISELTRMAAASLKSSDDAAYKDLHEFLERVARDLPLKENTDLFKYAIEDPERSKRIDDLVSEMLNDGMLSLGGAQQSEGIRQIIKIADFSRSNEENAVWFCTTDGYEIFHVRWVAE
jgi:hypothetical protein